MVDDDLARRDNYADFSAQLDASKEALIKREKPLRLAEGLVQKLSDESNESANQWQVRFDSLNVMIEHYDGSTEGYEKLLHLRSTASKMASTFRTRADNLYSKLDELAATYNRIAVALTNLDDAKKKLVSSRRDAEALAHLEQTTAQLTTGQIERINADPAVQSDILQARLAIASAEALIDIKESRHA